MKPVTIGHFCSVKEINQLSVGAKYSLREQIKILIVDDEPFVYLEQLRNAKFNVVQLPDVQDLNAISEYNIVICDINGVGGCLNSEYGGAFLISQMKKIYPYKQYAVYSGKNDYSAGMSEMLQGVASLKKDLSIEQWSAYLDQYIENVTNPRLVWKNIRDLLYNKDVSSFVVTKLEDEFVRIIMDNPQKLKSYPTEKFNKELSVDVRNIIQSIIANLLTLLLTV